jgi:hypothetical protein
MQRICGFLVVRKPDYAASERLSPNLRLDEKSYHGIDRLPWEDFALAYYDQKLSTPLLNVWKELKRSNSDLSGIEVLKSYERAKQVLALSAEKSETIAIWSPELEELKGATEAEVNLNYLGLDCLAKSKDKPMTVEWSVLLSGVYAEPSYFESAIDRLNDHGLLPSPQDCEAVFDRYVELSFKEIVEPLAKDAMPMSVKVFAAARRAD